MKKILLLLALLPISLCAHPRVSSDLKEAVALIYRLPEARQLLENVEAQGPIAIYSAPFRSNSNAMWVPEERAIVLNSLRKRPIGEKVRSILFEMHNAYATKEFDNLDNLVIWNKISKKEYILKVERLEHQNAIQTKSLIDKAIGHGLFPKESYWDIATDFNEHLQLQAYSGHSDAIGALYEELKRG